MADHGQSQTTPAPAPVSAFQTPDWETPSRPAGRSLMTKLVPSLGNRAPNSGPPPDYPAHPENALDKETLGLSNLPPRYDTSANQPATDVPTPRRDFPAPNASRSYRSRFDAVFPPHRTYFGRSRRFFLLFILLPVLVLLLFVLPLALGLGIGLSHKSSGSQSLALPGNAAVYNGDLTYYAPALGACGIESTDSDSICAVSHVLFDAASTGSNPNANPLCGKKIRITRNFVEAGVGNRSVDVTVVDRCVGCKETDLDLTISVFTQLANEEEGRVVGTWAWLN